MNRFTNAIRSSVQSANWYAALFMALTMPDICSKLELPTSGNSGPRYRDWFDKYLATTYTSSIGEREMVFMTSGDCWALRCSLLHEGSDDIGEQRAREILTRFRFTAHGSHRLRVDSILVLNTAEFCEEICLAVEAWTRDVSRNTDVQERIAAMVAVEVGAFSPKPGYRIR